VYPDAIMVAGNVPPAVGLPLRVIRLAADVLDYGHDLGVRPGFRKFCLAGAPGAVPVATATGIRVAVENVPFPIGGDVRVALCGPVQVAAGLPGFPRRACPRSLVGLVVAAVAGRRLAARVCPGRSVTGGVGARDVLAPGGAVEPSDRVEP
jgi:hypothetical protein